MVTKWSFITNLDKTGHAVQILQVDRTQNKNTITFKLQIYMIIWAHRCTHPQTYICMYIYIDYGMMFQIFHVSGVFVQVNERDFT
jgi:hypothetical protein